MKVNTALGRWFANYARVKRARERERGFVNVYRAKLIVEINRSYGNEGGSLGTFTILGSLLSLPLSVCMCVCVCMC